MFAQVNSRSDTDSNKTYSERITCVISWRCAMSIHRSLVDTQLTCFEPDTVGNMMRGLEYHRFFFDAGTRRLTFLPRCIALNAGRSSREKSVCASVCLSVKCMDRDKTKQKSVQIFYTIRKIIYPSFLRRRMVGVATPST